MYVSDYYLELTSALFQAFKLVTVVSLVTLTIILTWVGEILHGNVITQADISLTKGHHCSSDTVTSLASLAKAWNNIVAAHSP